MSKFISFVKPIRKKGNIKSKDTTYIKAMRLTKEQINYIQYACNKLDIPFNYFVRWVIISAAYSILHNKPCKELDILIKKVLK